MIIENEDGSTVTIRNGDAYDGLPIREAEGIEPSLILSTAHMPDTRPDFGDCSVLEYEFGYVLFVNINSKVPEWLQPIMKYAHVNCCLLINFDRDSDCLSMFQTYDW